VTGGEIWNGRKFVLKTYRMRVNARLGTQDEKITRSTLHFDLIVREGALRGRWGRDCFIGRVTSGGIPTKSIVMIPGEPVAGIRRELRKKRLWGGFSSTPWPRWAGGYESPSLEKRKRPGEIMLEKGRPRVGFERGEQAAKVMLVRRRKGYPKMVIGAQRIRAKQFTD